MTISRNSGKRWTFKDIAQAKKGPKDSQMSIDQYSLAVAVKKLETDIQQKLFEQLALIPYMGKTVKDFVYAIPNGGYRNKKTGGILKAEGVKKGVPDIHCFVAKAPYHSLYIEMKTETGELSDSQEMVIEMLREAGHKVVVCRNLNSAINELLKYLGISI